MSIQAINQKVCAFHLSLIDDDFKSENANIENAVNEIYRKHQFDLFSEAIYVCFFRLQKHLYSDAIGAIVLNAFEREVLLDCAEKTVFGIGK